MEVMVGPSGKRRWSDEYKGQTVAETLVPGVTINFAAFSSSSRVRASPP